MSDSTSTVLLGLAPGDTDSPRTALYTDAFAANPHGHYRAMRAQHGSLAPVLLAPDVPATLVLGYHLALRILHDQDHFPADPRDWVRGVPADCAVRPMMEPRCNAIRRAGSEHQRYRSAIAYALDGVDLHGLHKVVEDLAGPLIDAFCAAGSCDVVSQYALPITFNVLNTLLGCSPEISGRAAVGAAKMFDSGADAEDGNRILVAALKEHIGIKRAEPGDDITSRLIEHSARLDNGEMLDQLVLLFAAAISPPLNLITNTLLRMHADERFGDGLVSGSLSTQDALDEVLFEDPPMANYCITYPRQPTFIDGVWLPAHQPVVISIAGCNNDPEIRTDDLTGNRSHLAFSAGPHACPAREMGYLIAQDAIDQLLDRIPEMHLAVSAACVEWRPGPFHRALAALPVTFPPSFPTGNQ